MTSKFTSALEAFKPISLTALSINFFLALLCAWLLFSKYHSLAPQIPLWFSKTWGQERLASPGWVWLLPASSFLILVLNNTLATLLKQTKSLATMLVWFSAFFSLICFYTLYRILILAS